MRENFNLEIEMGNHEEITETIRTQSLEIVTRLYAMILSVTNQQIKSYEQSMPDRIHFEFEIHDKAIEEAQSRINRDLAFWFDNDDSGVRLERGQDDKNEVLIFSQWKNKFQTID